MQAILSFFFELDDIVDSPQTTSIRRVQLDERHVQLGEAIATGHSQDARLDFVVHAIRALDLPADLFDAQFTVLAREVQDPTPESFADWYAMYEPSAAIFASVAKNVMELEAPDAPVALRELAVGLNLIDLICDLPDDLREGRLLMPREDFERFAVDPSVLTPTREWTELVRFEIARARTLVESGSRVLALSRTGRAWILRVGVAVFSERLDAVERRNYDVFSRPPRLAHLRELIVALRSIAGSLATRRP